MTDVERHLVVRDALRREAARRLSPEEWQARAAIPVSDDERERALALVRWFKRRYPTPAERLAYVRRASRRWARAGMTARPDAHR